jgi:hypothetical protein
VDARDVLYYYARGKLSLVEGVNVRTTRDQGLPGRSRVQLGWTGRYITTLTDRGTTDNAPNPRAGEPIIAVEQMDDDGRVRQTRGYRGLTTIEHQQPNEARAFASSDARTRIRSADGNDTNVVYDAYGMPTNIRVSNAQDPTVRTATITYDPRTRFLVQSVSLPGGGSVSYSFDVDHATLRSRANLRSVTRTPAPNRPGDASPVTQFIDDYHPAYNYPLVVRDAEGRTVTMTPTLDHFDVAHVQYEGGLSETFSYHPSGQPFEHTSVDGVYERWFYAADTGFLSQHFRGNIQTQYAMRPAPRPGWACRAEW